eukprot:TRINITY_DN2315_c0_g1_i1.p1 TRINITY_DN2315_c0_g1~~TRINITY_DN2315_c0_g1_i1.p1  ORF type:complete len:438 (-),score=96.98 TRINITY_DN2315_c0_g1_i1:126-1439(-)
MRRVFLLLVLISFFAPSLGKRKQLQATLYGLPVNNIPLNALTFAGTHNSGAYSTNIIDCKNFQAGCISGWTSECTEQKQVCTGGTQEICTSSTKKCLNKLPKFLEWACTGWTKVCTATKTVCSAYSTVCTASSQFCKIPGPGCGVVNEIASTCVVANNWQHDFARQLQDGVRALDIDLCSINGQLFNCHTMDFVADLYRGSLAQIKRFLSENKNQFIIMGYSNLHGPNIHSLIDDEMKNYLCSTPACPEIFVLGQDKKFPTMGSLINSGKQILVRGYYGAFNSDFSVSGTWDETAYQDDMGKYKNWVLQKCGSNAADPNTVLDISGNLVQVDPRTNGKVNMKGIVDKVVDQVKQGKAPQCGYCLDCLAKKIAPELGGILVDCHKAGAKIFTFSTDNYWTLKLKDIGTQINALNIARFTKSKKFYKKFYKKFRRYYKK